MRHALLKTFLLLPTALVSMAEFAAGEAPDYARDVQPILVQYCGGCHGAETQESGLRLHTGAGLLQGGNVGPAVVAGNSGESLLIQALTGASTDYKMPPEGEPRPSDEQIALLRAWIDAGAIAPTDDDPAIVTHSDHWSFQPVIRREPPAVSDAAWVRMPLDAFILARLDAEGIRPSPEADRATLIRRLSLDLLGLPPTPAEVDAFLADSRPDAYEQLVERLLQSPHYGERQARHWLDLARYADSNGFTIDGPRSIWKYRDWVIEAYNRDLSFDRFAIDQLAGDMLPDAERSQIVATGFHRNTLINQEGGTDPEQFRVESVVDRVNTTGSVFLGLTIGCAQCHTHKFDPISHREYYQLFAFFNNADEPTVLAPGMEQSSQLTSLAEEIAAAELALAEHDAAQSSRQAEWEAQYAAVYDGLWTRLTPREFRSHGGALMTQLEDDSVLVIGNVPAVDTYTVVADVPPGAVTAVRVEALTHNTLSNGGPGLTENGNFSLTEFSLAAAPLSAAGEAGEPVPAPVTAAYADDAQADRPVAQAIDGDNKTAWSFAFQQGVPNTDKRAVFLLKDPISADPAARLTFTLDHQLELRPGLGRFLLSVTSAPAESVALAEEVLALLRIPAEIRPPAESEQLAAEFRKGDAARVPLLARLNELRRQERKIVGQITTTMVMQERSQPRETHIHIRGDFLRPGARVQPGVPAVLPPLPTAATNPNRADFARWLVDPANPLTPRVTVNRVWQQYFGVGLVETENDFGTQGSPPSHPELLDWLASEFVQTGWGVKALHRLIVTSAVYRQSSHARPDLASIDPRNKLLARQSRLRLEAETIRDAALAAGGLLSPKLGGPGVFPPQPEGIYRFTQQDKQWKASLGEDRYRRGMYTYFWRSSPDPFLMTFDAPTSNVTCTRRVRSNTPLQALTLANDATFVEIAQGLAARVLRESAAPSSSVEETARQRIRHAFRLCLAREPNEVEAARLEQFYRRQVDLFAASPAEAELLAPAEAKAQIAAADAATPPTVSLAEAAATTALARVLLNVDEFVTRE